MQPFMLTNDMRDMIVSDFTTKLVNSRITKDKFEYSFKIQKKAIEKDEKLEIQFTPIAYMKMWDLVDHYDSEVGWRGTVDRLDRNTFLIKDIYVFPQTVTSVTVTTDDKEYQDWLDKLSDDQFNKLRFYGHSHVEMSTTPSTTDMAERQGILDQLGDDDFIIFGIFNKKREMNFGIYLMDTGMMYDEEDVCVTVQGYDNLVFLYYADKNVVYQKTATYYPSSGTRVFGDTKTESGKKSKKKEEAVNATSTEYPEWNRAYQHANYIDPYDDDDDYDARMSYYCYPNYVQGYPMK